MTPTWACLFVMRPISSFFICVRPELERLVTALSSVKQAELWHYTQPQMSKEAPQKLVRGLSLLDATMIVVGSMIGSGIFITSAESSRLVVSPGWLLAAWALAGVLTITGALCCAELAAMWPRAGGQYVFLREAYGPSIGFLFGWGLVLIIKTGRIAAVALAFANFTGVFTSRISGDTYLIEPYVLLYPFTIK